MKNYLIVIAILCFSNTYAQLAGTYTIDKTSASSSTNFTSITSAIDSLISQGLSGDVELTLVSGSGPYT